MFDTINDTLDLLFSYVTSSQKRTYFVYTISSILLAFYVFRKEKINISFLQYFFSKEVWTSKSARIDYGFVVFNAFFKILCIGPFLYLSLHLAFHTTEYLNITFGYQRFDLSKSITLISYTIALTLVGDLSTYLIHWAMHKIPWLWEFHKVHHSATSLNPFTQYRLHPIELIINNGKNILILGLLTGIFDYLSSQHIHKITFLSVNIFSFAFFAWGANLRHSHVRLKYFSWLEFILISPLQHQVHHSAAPEHYNKNMGSKLALWDWIFGTLIRSKNVTSLNFGIGKFDDTKNSFLRNLWVPFVNVGKSLSNKLH